MTDETTPTDIENMNQLCRNLLDYSCKLSVLMTFYDLYNKKLPSKTTWVSSDEVFEALPSTSKLTEKDVRRILDNCLETGLLNNGAFGGHEKREGEYYPNISPRNDYRDLVEGIQEANSAVNRMLTHLS